MKETIIITNTLETGTSFGVVASTGEGVFIPASLARQFDLELSDEYEAVLAPNAEAKRGETPWRAVKMTGAPVHTEDDLEDDWDDQYEPPVNRFLAYEARILSDAKIIKAAKELADAVGDAIECGSDVTDAQSDRVIDAEDAFREAVSEAGE